MQTSEGRVMVNDAGQYKYEYYLRDHLGSVRARFTEGTNHQASLSGEVHYYPFGMTIAGQTVAGESSTDQLFSGKRLLNQNLNGTSPNWYDFGARNYDAQLGMWFNVDPMAEKYVSFSPYNYCFNNPISWVDPTGMMPEWLQPMWDATNWGEMTIWENGNGGFSEVARFAISGMGGNGGGNGFINLANGGTILVGGSVADGYRYAKQGQTVSESTPLLTASLYGATSNNSHGDINWTKIVGYIDGNTVILPKAINVFAKFMQLKLTQYGYYGHSLKGISFSSNLAFGKGAYRTGISVALLSDGKSYAMAVTVYDNPRKNPIAASITFSSIKVTSNNGEKVLFSDLAGPGEEFNIGGLIFEYGISGSPNTEEFKASTYKMESFGISLGFPITHGEFNAFTWIIPL